MRRSAASTMRIDGSFERISPIRGAGLTDAHSATAGLEWFRSPRVRGTAPLCRSTSAFPIPRTDFVFARKKPVDWTSRSNVFGDAPGRYPEVDPTEGLRRGATAALLPTEPYPFQTKDVAVEELVAVGYARPRVRLVDGEALTWYGAREPDGIRAVAATVRGLTTTPAS